MRQSPCFLSLSLSFFLLLLFIPFSFLEAFLADFVRFWCLLALHRGLVTFFR